VVQHTLHALALHRAAELLGSPEGLAMFLSVGKREVLDEWVDAGTERCLPESGGSVDRALDGAIKASNES
jgi:hypothetical protein